MPKINKEKSERDKIFNRISRIEGQVKGIKRMLESETDCLGVVTQITAAKAALSMLGVEILKNQICSKKSKEVDEKYLKKIFEINN